MTWIGEVAHVAWKDVRQQRWLIVAYAALVAMATIRAVLYATIGNTASPLSAAMLLVVLLGCILAAVVIQGDSPTRADAFWRSRPLRSSVIVGAKLLVVAGIVIALPLLGEAIGLAAFDVSVRDVPLLLLACVTSFGMWLMIAVLLGSLTSDLRTFVVAFIALLIGMGLLTAYVAAAQIVVYTWTRGESVSVGIAAAVLGVLTFVLLYQQRSWRWLAWSTTALASAGALLTIFAPSFEISGKGNPVSVGLLEASIDRQGVPIGRREMLAFTITAPQAPDSITSAFYIMGVTAELADGSKVNLREVQPTSVRLHTADIPVGPISWLRHDIKPPVKALVILTGEEQQALARGVRAFVLTGRVVTLRPQILGTMPLRAGSRLNSNGTQTRIVGVERMANDVKVDVNAVGIDPTDYRSSLPGFNERRAFALVNAPAGEGLALTPSATGSGSDWLLLPGAPVSQNSFRLESQTAKVPAEQAGDPPDEWYRDANLVVARWQTIGSYVTTIRTTGSD